MGETVTSYSWVNQRGSVVRWKVGLEGWQAGKQADRQQAGRKAGEERREELGVGEWCEVGVGPLEVGV